VGGQSGNPHLSIEARMHRSNLSDFLFTRLRTSQVWASHVTLLLMVGSLFLQIVARQLNWQIDWTEELSRFAFIAMVFVTASYASQMDTHLKVAAFAEMIEKWRPAKWIIRRLQFIAIMLFDCLFFWYCILNLLDGLQYPNMSPAIGFNENWLFLAPILGFGAAILQKLLSIYYTPPKLEPLNKESLNPS
jgi:TRAP-type C4-dicarboxylate transport system permease small subunit